MDSWCLTDKIVAGKIEYDPADLIDSAYDWWKPYELTHLWVHHGWPFDDFPYRFLAAMFLGRS